jgi:Domain of unknown function (DUF4336)
MAYQTTILSHDVIHQRIQMLRNITDNVWVAEQPLRFAGLQVGARMTVLRLNNGSLLLHSPISYSEDLAAAVDALGNVAFVVAPNRFHHLFVGQWHNAYPHCQVHVTRGLEKKRADLTITSVLSPAQPLDFSAEIAHIPIEGFNFASEVVFFHKRSRTLITTDLLFNIGPSQTAMTRFMFRMMRAYGRPSSTLLERLMVKDRERFLQSIDEVLAWPIDKLILAHGEIVNEDGGAALDNAYRWLRKS